MVNYRPSPRNAVIAACISVLALICIFVLPYVIVKDIADKVIPMTEDTIDAMLTEDWNRASADIEYVVNLLDKSEKKLMLFIDHELIDELIAAAQGTRHLVQMHDDGQVFTELEFIVNRMHYLEEAESFTIGNLL
jgi:hypothetical protein